MLLPPPTNFMLPLFYSCVVSFKTPDKQTQNQPHGCMTINNTQVWLFWMSNIDDKNNILFDHRHTN